MGSVTIERIILHLLSSDSFRTNDDEDRAQVLGGKDIDLKSH